jgi:hypothetical protein
MRTAQTRTQARRTLPAALAAALALAGAYSACSYDELKPAITVVIHNIPATVDHLTVVLNDSANGSVTRTPSFGIGSFSDLEVVFPAVTSSGALATGVVTIVVTALDHDQSPLAAVTLTGNYTGPGLVVEGTLVVQTGFVGSFGAPCGNNSFCGNGLTCTKYSGTDIGLCTRDCGGASAACDAVPSGASCQPFKAAAGQGICQWECDNADGGANLACPTGLSCGSQITIGGVAKRFCQGSTP